MLSPCFRAISSLIALAALCCTSPKPASAPGSSAGMNVPAAAAQGHESDSSRSVAVDLRDGSRIIGTALLPGLTLASPYGPVAFRLEQVGSIMFSDSASVVTVDFRNGDMLRGSLQIDSLPVQFAGGRLSLPVSALLRISIVSPEKELARGLIAHYPLAGDTRDATGGRHDAVNHGAVPAPDRFGRPDHAYEFDGREARINLPEGLVDPNAAACTLSLWVLAKPPIVLRQVLYIGAATAELSIWSEGGKIGFGAALPDRLPHGVTALLPENTFVHLVAVYIRGKSVRLYLNGSRKSETTIPDLPLVSGLMEYSSGIGAYAPEHPEQGQRWGKTNWFGSISDVRIYNRALSDDEIVSLGQIRN